MDSEHKIIAGFSDEELLDFVARGGRFSGIDPERAVRVLSMLDDVRAEKASAAWRGDEMKVAMANAANPKPAPKREAGAAA